MDNFHIDITSQGDLEPAMRLAMQGHKAQGYAIRDAVEGERWEAPEGYRFPHLMGWKSNGKPKRLVFFWVKSSRPDYVALPFEMDADGLADFARRWLGSLDFGREPDHDGDNGKGWRIYCEGWGHVDGEYQAFVAVSPAWAMYGK